jgi:cell division transport system permease protein
MITVWRVFKNGFINFIRNGVLSFASTTIMVLTLLTLSLFFIVNVAMTSGIKAVQEKIDASVYLSDKATQNEILILQTNVAKQPEVKAVKYVSKDEALKRYKEQNAGNKQLLESLQGMDNPLPASLEVKVYDPTKLDQVTRIFEEPKYKVIITKVSYKENKVVIDKLIAATNFIKKIGFVATAAFAMVSLIIIYNTIRIAIFSQKDDIEIMRLVGGTDWYIRGPYIVEGALYGIIATIITMIALGAVIYYISPSLNSYFGSTGVDTTGYLRNNIPSMVALQLIIGIVIGVTSSWLAMRRYLRATI